MRAGQHMLFINKESGANYAVGTAKPYPPRLPLR
jgi:hypothetical protein